jgi:hypothetical protein
MENMLKSIYIHNWSYTHDFSAIFLHMARNAIIDNISKIHMQITYTFQVISNLLKLINSRSFKNYSEI